MRRFYSKTYVCSNIILITISANAKSRFIKDQNFHTGPKLGEKHKKEYQNCFSWFLFSNLIT